MKIYLLFFALFTNYLFAQNDLDSLNYYFNKGNYEKAISFGDRQKAILGENSIIYHGILISTAILFDKKGDSKKAEMLFLRSYELQKANLNKENIINYILLVDMLGVRYSNKQDTNNTEKYYLESLELKEKTFGRNNKDFAYSLSNLGMLYSQQSEFSKSRKKFVEVNTILKNLKLEYSDDNKFVLKAIASGCRREGKYDLSEKYYKELIKIIEITNGQNGKEYIIALQLLATNYSDKGDFMTAEELYLKSLNLIKERDSYQYLSSVIDVADFYLAIKNSVKALDLLKEADALYTKINVNLKESDVTHCFLTRVWQNYYMFIEDYKSALKMALKKVQLTEGSPLFGSLSNAYSEDLSDLALAYKNLQDYKNSEKYYFQSYEIRKKHIGEYPRNDSQILLSIALIYQRNKDVINAEKYFLQSITMFEDNLGENVPFHRDLLYYLANFYFDISKPNIAAKYLINSFSNSNQEIVQFSSFLSINEFASFQKTIEGNRNLPTSFLNNNPTQFPEINIGCYENELLLKNLSLRNQQRIKTNIQKSGDTMLQNNYEQFVANKRQLNKLQELPINKRPTSYEQLTTETEKLEKELTRQSALFADSKNALSIGWKKVQEKLLPNELAIDIVAFNYYNKKWTDSIVYAAFVVKKEFKTPKYIPLFEQKQLEFMLNKSKTELNSTAINNHYTNKSISDLFLKPLEQDLKNCNVVYIAPAGLAHQINFKALPVSETVTFGEQYQVHLLGATSELVAYKVSQLNKNTNLQLYLYGGIDYNKKDNSTEIAENNEDLTAESFKELSTRNGTSKFSYLPRTKVEIAQIAATSKQNGLLATVLSETNATEESIKKLDGKTTPYVLHFATHGFFFPNTKQELPEPKLQFSDEITKSKIYKNADDPMMRSGLLFAGANKFWGKTTINTKEEDGILTASEISNLDLSACQLVVMSACETGLGQINGSEGVYGLQRAFKMAGVKNIIMSLWKVPDVQTAELFDIFYKTCFSGKSIHDAFQIAQSEMKQKYPPYYWAGFVLLE